MKKILITGATGNVGIEVINYLNETTGSNKIIAGVRNIEKAKRQFDYNSNLEYVNFDFENPATFNESLLNIDRVFLLRPPHIADIDKYFRPLFTKIKENKINDIVFLSVQGAEISKVIPHNKIENLMRDFGFDYINLRPSYFMQNLTTTLIDAIKNKRQIILPAGKAKFNWIDLKNIGETAAILLNRFPEFKNQSFELTGRENENFYAVTDLLNLSITSSIQYKNVNPFLFYKIKKREGMAKGMIMVMILLHFQPRFQKEPRISDFYEHLTGKKPTSLNDFIQREKDSFN